MAAPSTSGKRKQWKDLGSEREILRENGDVGKEKQQPVKIRFTTRRDTFVKRRAQHNYVTKEAADDSKDVRGSRDPVYDVFRLESDIGIQAVKQLAISATQTNYNRQVSVCVQAEPTQVDARLVPGKEPTTLDPRLKRFLTASLPRMLHHLTQNNEVPIYSDDYLSLTEEDAFVGTREDNFLREAGNYTPAHTKRQHITGIDWRPGSKSIIAVTCIAPIGLAERLEKQRLVEGAVALVWNLEDTMHPQFILDSPYEVLCIKFNPTRPHLVVGGCMNGQVVVWNLDLAPDTRAKQVAARGRAQHHQDQDLTAIPPMPKPVKGHSLERVGDVLVSRLQPCQISKVEMSHKRAVHDIAWVPDGLEFQFDGRLVPFAENKRGADGSQSAGPDQQFATISEDGYMFIWDLSPAYLPQDKLRKLKHQSKLGGDEPWVPVLKYALQRPDGSGEMFGVRLALEGRKEFKDPSSGSSTIAPSYQMCCGSIEGELAMCSIAPKDDKAQQPAFGDDGAKKEAKLVRTLATAHAGPVWSLQRHPQLSDYYLTCGDWGFKVWKTGLASPILCSPCGEQQMMCARWSPTRASVVLVGTRDGFIHVWDLLDRSHEPVLVHPMIQDAITTLEFKPVVAGKAASLNQLIVLGTKIGSFHLFGLPKVLVKGHSHELRNMSQFLERETRRVAYFQWRWRERMREMDRQLQERNEISTGGGGGASGGGGSGSGPRGAGAGGANGLIDDGEEREDADFAPNEAAERAFMEKVAMLSEAAQEDE